MILLRSSSFQRSLPWHAQKTRTQLFERSPVYQIGKQHRDNVFNSDSAKYESRSDRTVGRSDLGGTGDLASLLDLWFARSKCSETPRRLVANHRNHCVSHPVCRIDRSPHRQHWHAISLDKLSARKNSTLDIQHPFSIAYIRQTLAGDDLPRYRQFGSFSVRDRDLATIGNCLVVIALSTPSIIGMAFLSPPISNLKGSMPISII